MHSIVYITYYSLTFFLAFSLACVRVHARSTASGVSRSERVSEGVAPLLKSRDPHLGGGEKPIPLPSLG